MMLTKIIPILIASFLVSGCASTLARTMKNLDQVPRIQTMNHSILKNIREPDQNPIILAVYGFTDQTGQQKPGGAYAEMSKAVTQGSSNLLIKALKDVGDGKWFRVVERESLQSLLQERKLIRTTRQITQGDKAKPLGPMLYAGAYLTGGIIGYDSNTLTGGVGYRFLGIGSSVQYRQDTVTVMLRLINVISGEIELAIMVEKTIMSVGAGGDKFKYLDLDTQLLEVEAGVAVNEPVTYAVRKTIEGAVVEMIRAGERKGIWHYKPEPWKDPGKIPKVEVEIPTDTELLEALRKIESIPLEDTPADVETTPAPQPEQVDKPLKVKVEPPLSDGIVCESSTHHFRCTEVANEKTITDTDTSPSGN